MADAVPFTNLELSLRGPRVLVATGAKVESSQRIRKGFPNATEEVCCSNIGCWMGEDVAVEGEERDAAVEVGREIALGDG